MNILKTNKIIINLVSQYWCTFTQLCKTNKCNCKKADRLCNYSKCHLIMYLQSYKWMGNNTILIKLNKIINK